VRSATIVDARIWILGLSLSVVACGRARAERAEVRITPDPATTAAPSASVTTFAWGPGSVTISEDSWGVKTIRIVGAAGPGIVLEDVEHLDVCELVEIDGAPPRELWIADSAGAHGNRTDRFYGWNGGAPKELFSVDTDEGDLALEDIDADGRPELVGEATIYFDADAWDFRRPVVIAYEKGAFVDVTLKYPERLRAMRTENEVAPPYTCMAGNAIEVLGLSMMLGDESKGAAFVEASCEGAVDWMHKQRAALRTHVRSPVLVLP
jgi:hypothetical protein